MRLLVDEDSQAKVLVRLLKSYGHSIFTVNDLGIAGAPDEEVLTVARKTNRVLLTHNCNDFKELHISGLCHAGILLVYRSSNRAKNMDYQSIAQAVNNLEKLGMELSNQCIELNHWMH